MPSKLDLLRSGEVVEIEPGRKVRLNQKDKMYETSEGKRIYVGDNPHFFPANENQLAHSKEKEKLKGEINKNPLGEFLYQFGNQGGAGAAKDWINKFTKSGEDYLRNKQVQTEVSEEISENSPWTSAAATAASFVPDIALTKGMTATKAAPLLTAAHAGPRILEEPAQVAGEAALSAAGGKIIEMGGNFLQKAASRRGAMRELPEQQAAVRKQNALGQQAVESQNAFETGQHNLLKQNIKSINESRLQQHEADLNARQNRMIQAKNAEDQARVARDSHIIQLKNRAEIAKAQNTANAAQEETKYRLAKQAAHQEEKRLAEEFKFAQSQYQESLKSMPELQKKAQEEYSQNVIKKSQEIEKAFPPSSKIISDDLNVGQFIDEGIKKTGFAGTPEASRAGKIIQSIFPEGEILSGRELSKRYTALEGAIQKSSPEVQTILNDFKTHLGQTLPSVLEDSIAYGKISPLLNKTIGTDIKSVLGDLGLGKDASNVLSKADSNARMFLKTQLNSSGFAQKLQNKDLSRQIASKVLTVEDFLGEYAGANRKLMAKQGNLNFLEMAMQQAEQKHSYFVSELSKKLDARLAKYELKAMENASSARKNLSKQVKETFGLAEPVAPPMAPNAPNPVAMPAIPGAQPQVPPIQLPPPINPAQALPMPPRPAMMGNPSPPTPQGFTPQPEPILGPAQGMAERAGELLEGNPLAGGKGMLNNPVAKLAGLKYLAGKATLPLEAGYLGMKGLTSPTPLGEAARMTFKQGGIQAVNSWAEKYPSYQQGILEDPRDRRSFAKEIENAQDIPLEQKAMMQSKVNRGKPLNSEF